MKANELFKALQELIEAGYGEKHVYVNDALVVGDVHLIRAVEVNKHGIELSTAWHSISLFIRE